MIIIKELGKNYFKSNLLSRYPYRSVCSLQSHKSLVDNNNKSRKQILYIKKIYIKNYIYYILKTTTSIIYYIIQQNIPTAFLAIKIRNSRTDYIYIYSSSEKWLCLNQLSLHCAVLLAEMTIIKSHHHQQLWTAVSSSWDSSLVRTV